MSSRIIHIIPENTQFDNNYEILIENCVSVKLFFILITRLNEMHIFLLYSISLKFIYSNICDNL